MPDILEKYDEIVKTQIADGIVEPVQQKPDANCKINCQQKHTESTLMTDMAVLQAEQEAAMATAEKMANVTADLEGENELQPDTVPIDSIQRTEDFVRIHAQMKQFAVDEEQPDTITLNRARPPCSTTTRFTQQPVMKAKPTPRQHSSQHQPSIQQVFRPQTSLPAPAGLTQHSGFNPTLSMHVPKKLTSSKPFYNTVASTSKTTTVPSSGLPLETDPAKTCIIHNASHALRDCRVFQKKPINEGKHILMKNKICCKCCLSMTHQARDCKEPIQCLICSIERHISAMQIGFTRSPASRQEDGGEDMTTQHQKHNIKSHQQQPQSATPVHLCAKIYQEADHAQRYAKLKY
eukprot:gene7935-13826_t